MGSVLALIAEQKNLVTNQTCDIFITIDTGSSSTRGFFYADFGADIHRGFVHQPPMTEFKRASQYENNKNRCDAQTSMVKYGKAPDFIYQIVGAGACTNGVVITDATLQKYHDVPPKVLAFVGECMNRIPSIPHDEVRLQLDFMLPIGEHTQFRDLEQDLTRYLYEYEWNGIHMDFAEVSAKACIEGAGVAATIPANLLAYILVWGHKDLSLACVQNGLPLPEPKSKTLTGFGMSKIVHEAGCFTDDVIAAKAIFRYIMLMKKPGKEDSAIKEIAALVDEAKLPMKLTDIRETIEGVWLNLEQILKRHPGLAQADKVFLTGGNTPIWNDRVKALFEGRYNNLSEPIKAMKQLYPELARTHWLYSATDVFLKHLDVIGQSWQPALKGVKQIQVEAKS